MPRLAWIHYCIAVCVVLIFSTPTRSAHAAHGPFVTAATACPATKQTGTARTDALNLCKASANYSSDSCKLARINLALAAFHEGNSSCETAVRSSGEIDALLSPTPTAAPTRDQCAALLVSADALLRVFPYVAARAQARGQLPFLPSLAEAQSKCIEVLLAAGVTALPQPAQTKGFAAAACAVPPVTAGCGAAALVFVAAATMAILVKTAIDALPDPRVLECEGIYQSYKALGNPSKCLATDNYATRLVKTALLQALIAGRSLYLTKFCDYVLDGSIARGSATAEAGHKTQLDQLTKMLQDCQALPYVP
jgi:hypothetical protein